FGDGHAFGRIAQLRVARQVPNQDDFVVAGHGARGVYFAAGFGSAALVNITRNTSSLSAKRFLSLLTTLGSLSKITFTLKPELCFLSGTREKFFLSIFWTVSTLPPAEVISEEILSMASLMPSSLPAVSNMNKPSYRFMCLALKFSNSKTR